MLEPNYVVHPAISLRDWMQRMGKSLEEVTEAIKAFGGPLPGSWLKGFLDAEEVLDHEKAFCLAYLTSTTSSFWLNRQRTYFHRLHKLVKKKKPFFIQLPEGTYEYAPQ